MNVLELVTAVLADYRLSTLVSKDKIFEPVRAGIGRRASGSKFWQFVADLVTCPYCLGVWFAVAIVLLDRFGIGRVFVKIMAIAGGQDLIQTVCDNLSGGQDAA